MSVSTDVTLETVKQVYDGPEGDLWELLMGQQIHIGGLVCSQDLADKAGIAAGTRGVDLCACTGAGMRFLLRFRDVAHMTGVDATDTVVARARTRNADEGYLDRTTMVTADATATGLDDDAYDFVWGEDAWCYVVDKPALIHEAARLVAAGGTIAFTDWVEGPAGLADADARRFETFMKFPNLQSITGYTALLEEAGCEVLRAEDTGRFPAHVDLYRNMVGMQLTSDVLRIIDYDMDLMNAIAGEMQFMQGLAHAGNIAQGLFVARKA
ncbi:MAG: class I SAM-dependent methyltransferase [Rhodosalinus sp.]